MREEPCSIETGTPSTVRVISAALSRLELKARRDRRATGGAKRSRRKLIFTQKSLVGAEKVAFLFLFATKMLGRISQRSAVVVQANTRAGSSLIFRPNHPSNCNCRSCSATISTLLPPTRPTAPSRALSTLLFKPNHPTNCHCHSCTADISSLLPPTQPTAPTRSYHAPATAPEILKTVPNARGMKVRSAIKVYCNGCNIIRRKGTVFVICSKDPKHKQVSIVVPSIVLRLTRYATATRLDLVCNALYSSSHRNHDARRRERPYYHNNITTPDHQKQVQKRNISPNKLEHFRFSSTLFSIFPRATSALDWL